MWKLIIVCVTILVVNTLATFDDYGHNDDILKILEKLSYHDLDLEHGINKKIGHDMGSKDLLLSKLLAHKGKDLIDIDIDFDDKLWQHAKGLEAAEFKKLLPSLLVKAKLFDHDKLDLLDHDVFDIDDGLWGLFKGLGSKELLELLPLLLLKTKLLHQSHSSGLPLGDGDHGLLKLLPLLLAKGKLTEDTFHLDDGLWNIIKGLEAMEAAKLLPLFLGHDKPFNLDHSVWDFFKGLNGHEANLLLPLLPILLEKGKLDLHHHDHDLGGSAELTKLLPLLLASKKATLDTSLISGSSGHSLPHSLDHDHGLFDFDDSVWALLKGFKAAELGKVLPVLLGKDKLEHLGLGHGIFDIDEHLWELCKGLEVAELAKLLPLLLEKGKVIKHGGDDLGPLLKIMLDKKDFGHVDYGRDHLLDQLKFHALNIQSDDCYDCYDDPMFHY